MNTCSECKHACGKGRWATPTLEKDGYAICDRVVFNDEPFWDGTSNWKKTEKPVVPAWVVDGSDYWAGLHVTPDFGCVLWESR